MKESNSHRHQWQPLLDEYQKRIAAGRAMGGETKLEKRRTQQRLNARERINLLADADSFAELGTLVGGVSHNGLPTAAADGLIAGSITIEGRLVLVGAEDFTVQGGSIGLGTHAKRLRLAQLAEQEQLPLILMLEGAGERMTNALERYPYAPNDLQALAQLRGQVPTIAMVMGASAGHSALSGLLMDWVVMVEGSALFSAGPPLVQAALGEQVTVEELGGARMHTQHSGVGHQYCESEQQACELVRRYLSFMPARASDCAEVTESDTQPRILESMLDIIPPHQNMPYDIKRVIALLQDERSDWLEIQPDYARSMVTGFARIAGQAVAILANQPMVMAGAITAEAAEKAAHFLELVEAYQLPAVFLADNPGIMSGSQAEKQGTLRSAARMYAAQARLRSPKLHITLRKAFGFGGSLMAMNPFDQQTISYGLPGVALGGMPAFGGGQAANADDQMQAQLQAAEESGAWSAGDNLCFDEIIDPRELRNALLRGLALAQHRIQPPPRS